jgi:N4-gp56 family major capsid protein
MARSQMTTSDALRKQAWEEDLFRDTAVNSYFLSKFASEATTGFVEKGEPYESVPNNVMHVRTDMGAKGRTKTRNGDKMTFGLVPRLDPQTNQGVTSGQTLKGKEVALTQYNYDLELERYRQAVSAGGVMDWSRASFDMPKESRNALQTWGAEKMDLLCFQALEDSPTEIFYKTSDTGPAVSKTATLATAKAALSADDSKVTPAFLHLLKTWCRTGGARAGSKIPPRPIMVDGKPYYIFLTHPDVEFDFGNDSTNMQAQREAEVRGKDNPLFSGATAVWKGMIIHTHEFVTTGTDGGGASVPWAYGHVLGAQSLCVGFGERPSIVEETEDYEEDLFYAWRMTMKVDTPEFNSKRYGSISTIVSRTNISGI